jgi:hypothetical protein
VHILFFSQNRPENRKSRKPNPEKEEEAKKARGEKTR